MIRLLDAKSIGSIRIIKDFCEAEYIEAVEEGSGNRSGERSFL
jgi:hypothetical protein